MGLPVINPVMTGANIKKNMKKAGLSAEGLMDAMGIADKSTIYKWLRGDTLPDIANIVALASILNVTVDELLATA